MERTHCKFHSWWDSGAFHKASSTQQRQSCGSHWAKICPFVNNQQTNQFVQQVKEGEEDWRREVGLCCRRRWRSPFLNSPLCGVQNKAGNKDRAIKPESYWWERKGKPACSQRWPVVPYSIKRPFYNLTSGQFVFNALYLHSLKLHNGCHSLSLSLSLSLSVSVYLYLVCLSVCLSLIWLV